MNGSLMIFSGKIKYSEESYTRVPAETGRTGRDKTVLKQNTLCPSGKRAEKAKAAGRFSRPLLFYAAKRKKEEQNGPRRDD
ncbi:hypothetical protein A5N82_03585 [Christensenella minuta]|uniref:Uncharacterized protein n=1 Tax=Christensenella minuta TaxID=626937 RepID=A0A136Q4S9_9FIRM|nr:hypothetical protein B1H56_10425 [Christensenella minuta]KXK65662.1 hypothetical protein HMPREF3293_01496 [Christensenella minuta]OAQ42459.1 hypothetical protein A5N82_03585 [Christensenella minuta]